MRRPTALLVLGAFVLAALSVALGPWALAFDAEAWVVWGRELLALDVDATAGPSWKPGPVLVTAPLSLLGPAAAAVAWAVCGRAGALLAAWAAWRLARALGAERWGAGAAAAAVALAPWWLLNGALANSEGWLAAFCLLALAAAVRAAHDDQAGVAPRRDRAGAARGVLVLGTAAGLLRPEVWPFLLGWWWVHRAELGWRGVPLACAVVLAVAWIGPDVLGWGGALSAGEAATGPASEGAAANADVPLLAVLGDLPGVAGWAVVLGALAAVALWARGRGAGPAAHQAAAPSASGAGRALGWVAGAAVAWWLLVAVMAQGGFAGTPRYLVPAAAALAAVAGAGVGRLPRRGRPVAALGLVALVAVQAVPGRVDDARQVDRRDGVRAGLEALAVPCRPVSTTAEPQRTALARVFELPIRGRFPAARTGAVLALDPQGRWRAAC